jgi:hypothetical protein
MYNYGSYQEYLEQYEQYMEFMMSDTVSNIMSLIMALAFAVVAYIFQGRAMYAVARRRGIEKPWLAWVPVGNAWLMGCISDQYRYVKLGQVKNKRKLLMWLEIGVLAGTLVASAALILLAMQGIDLLKVDYSTFNEAAAERYAVSMLGILAVCFVLVAVSVAYTIVYYTAVWDYYHSCNPQRAKLFFLLSVLVSYPQPFFMFMCRERDLGMPPRRDALPEVIEMPPYTPPVWEE